MLRNVWWLGSATVGLAFECFGDIVFTEVSARVGILPYSQSFGMTGGVAASDFDSDGDIDIYLPNKAGLPDQLYRNLGDGTFEEIAIPAGVSTILQTRAALWFDYDGDTDLDLLVARDGYGPGISNPSSTLALYRQIAPAQFQNVATAAGLSGDLLMSNEPRGVQVEVQIGGLAAADVNNDGWLDFVLSLWKGGALLFLNGTDGTFTNITESSGIGASNFFCWQPIFHDFNGDGWMDFFQAADFEPNHLWINQHDNTFIDVAPDLGLDTAFNEMGVTLGDFDNDGDLDLFVTNIAELSVDLVWKHNVFFRNDSTPERMAFSEIAEECGIDDTGWGWGCTFADFNRDTLPDLAVVNGFNNPNSIDDPSRLFLNAGGTPDWFVDASEQTGFHDTEVSTALIAADFDRDGDLDLAQTCNLGGPFRVLRNDAMGVDAKRRSLVVQPRMEGPNHFAIGAIVRATVGDTNMTRLITAGTSLQGQEPAEAFFGLGDAAIVDSVTVEWPDGAVTVLEDIAADQVVAVTPGVNVNLCPADFDDDDHVGIGDLLLLLAAWSSTGDLPSDLNEDGTVGFADLLMLLSEWGPCE